MILDFTFIQVPNPILLQPLMYPFALGPLYLAAMLEKAGAKVACVDLRGVDLRDKELNPDLVPRAKWYGLTATTPEIKAARSLAVILKARDPSSRTIIGGAHATALPQDCVEYFDVVGTGEWEHSIVKLLEEGQVEGAVYGGATPDLDVLPFPARHLVGERAFSTTIMPGERWGEGEKGAMIISSRGCPYNCHFCASARSLPIRLRSPENVAAEVQELKERYNCHAFRDESDNLNLNSAWLFRLCNLLEPLKVTWKGHGRSRLLTPEICKAMREAGLIEFGIGVESADPKVLKLIGKEETVEDHLQAVALLKKYGIVSKIYLMSGLPGETEETPLRNATFMEYAQPDKWTLSEFVPLPGCEVWKNPEHFEATISKDNLADYWFFDSDFAVEYKGASREILKDRYQRLLSYLKSNQWRG